MSIVESRRTVVFNKLYVVLTGVLLCSAILGGGFSGINSICTILLVLVWIVEGDFKMKWQRLRENPFVWLIAFFFFLYIWSIWISKNKHEAFSQVQREFVIAFVLSSKKPFTKEQVYALLKLFVYGTFAWMCFATVLAIWQYRNHGDVSVFLYHALAHQVGSTAIFASMLCVISVAVILFLPANSRWKTVLYIFFTIWLVLLSSRMFLFIHVVISAVHLFTRLPLRYRLWPLAGLAGIVLLLSFTNNPVKSRFVDMEGFHAAYLTQPTFNEGIYFDGLSLRLIYIRYSMEIMQEHHGYVFGVGTGDAASLLRDKIRAYHMDIGDGSVSEKGGYLQYSFHDVYLQSFVAFGIVGLLAILAVYGYIGYLGIQQGVTLLRDLFIIMVLSSFTDVIVINDQCDLSLILTVCCLCMMLFQPGKNKHRVQVV